MPYDYQNLNITSSLSSVKFEKGNNLTVFNIVTWKETAIFIVPIKGMAIIAAKNMENIL